MKGQVLFIFIIILSVLFSSVVYSCSFENYKAQRREVSEAYKDYLKEREAKIILNMYIASHPILEGCSVRVRVPPNPKWQGCAYYTLGIIIINPNHTASLEKIIWHECKHIIDWREDQHIDYNDFWN